MQCIYLKLYHRGNNHGKYADGFCESMIDDEDGHIPGPLILFTCTALRHALLECEQNNGFHLKACKSKLKAHSPDRLNYFKYKNDCRKNSSCCSPMGRKLLTSAGVAQTY